MRIRFFQQIPAALRIKLRLVWRFAVLGLALTALGWAGPRPAAAQGGLAAQMLQSLTPDQLQQIQQQMGGAGSTQGSQSSSTPPITIQPAQLSAAPPAGPNRLEKIMSARAGIPMFQFGYDQLGVGQAVTVPQTGAIQDNYVLGPGDEIDVMLQGQENASYRVYVDRNGQVTLPKLPPISASGRTLGAFRRDLLAAIRRAYVSTEGYVSVGQVRQVSVLVSGEVFNPGTRVMTGLSTPLDAILVSGGIRKRGSLRNVKLVRNGHETSLDLYSVLTRHGSDMNILLADGDRIIVPTLGPTVAIAGWVRRSAIYELPPGASVISVRGLLSLAGGMEVRGKYRLSLLKLDQNGNHSLIPVNESGTVRDGDVLFVQPAADQTERNATLSGNTSLAGGYAIGPGTKLSDIVKAPGALGDLPYTLLGVISRRDQRTYLRKLIAFSPISVLDDREDMTLQTGDIVRVFSMDEVAMLRDTLNKYVSWQRARDEAARNPAAATAGQLAQSYDFRAKSGAGTASSDTGAVAALQAAQQTNTAVSSQALINTLANQPSPSASPPGGPSTPTAPAPSGTLSADAEATTLGDIADEINVPDLVLANFLSDRVVDVNGAVNGPGIYLVGPDVSLADIVEAAGGMLRWADTSGVELTTTNVDAETGRSVTRRATLPLNKGMLASYIVQPGDEFQFRKVFNDVDLGSIAVQGEVRFPGKYEISRGDHLSNLLVRAGGLTDVAYPYGTVFLRRSAAALEKTGYSRAAREIEDEMLVAMASRSTSEKLSPDAFAAMQGFVNDLRNTQAIGRITVVADPSLFLADPSTDLLLEPGDVVYIPQRPSTVAVLGQVLQPGSFAFRPGTSVEDYISLAGGYAQFADESQTFIILPDGTARRYEPSWLNFGEQNIPPGSAVVVPRDVEPLGLHQLILDTTQIMSQLAVSAASLAVLSKQ